jgi:excisionase family DNA binding protein
MEPMMTARQVAELLGVHENWVYDHAASGELPSYKIGGVRRFIRDEIDGYIAGLREPERKRPERRASRAKKPSRPKATRRSDDPQPRLFE